MLIIYRLTILSHHCISMTLGWHTPMFIYKHSMTNCRCKSLLYKHILIIKFIKIGMISLKCNIGLLISSSWFWLYEHDEAGRLLTWGTQFKLLLYLSKPLVKNTCTNNSCCEFNIVSSHYFLIRHFWCIRNLILTVYLW